LNRRAELTPTILGPDAEDDPIECMLKTCGRRRCHRAWRGVGHAAWVDGLAGRSIARAQPPYVSIGP